MNEKHSLQSFVSDIDKIVSGEALILSEREDCDEEYKELLFLAQILAKADYTSKTKKVSYIRKTDELQDDELDMVAGGINLYEILDEKGKKDDGI